MLHVLRVAFAFGCTRGACLRACFDDRLHDIAVSFGVASEDARGRSADIGAVVIEPDAADEWFGLRLCAACVRARDTHLRAVETCFDAAEQCCIVEQRAMIRMLLQHLMMLVRRCMSHGVLHA